METLSPRESSSVSIPVLPKLGDSIQTQAWERVPSPCHLCPHREEAEQKPSLSPWRESALPKPCCLLYNGLQDLNATERPAGEYSTLWAEGFVTTQLGHHSTRAA